jgi:hypothetical protein
VILIDGDLTQNLPETRFTAGCLCEALGSADVRYPDCLPQRGRVFMAAFELEHHPFDVFVTLVRSEELQGSGIILQRCERRGSIRRNLEVTESLPSISCGRTGESGNS